MIIIILFLPAVCSGAAEKVWLSQSSGFVKQGGSLSLENYSLKVEALSSNKALITVYKGVNKIGSREYNVSESEQYDSIRVTLLRIEGEYAWISMSELKNIDVWILAGKKLLRWGERYHIENHTIEIATFNSSGVNLNISNHNVTKTDFFSEGDIRDYDSLRIAVKEINMTGFVRLEFFTNKKPFQARLLSDNQVYFPDETPIVEVYISSKVVQNVVGIILDTMPPAVLNPKVFSASGLKGRQVYISRMSHLPENSTITINAKILSFDFHNNTSITTLSRNITITPIIGVKKLVPLDTDEDKIPVTLWLHNAGEHNVSINLQDTIPEELGGKTLNWSVMLEAKNSTNISYVIQPRKPGIYILPPAIARWNNHISLSKEVEMRVHMPYLHITKTKNNDGNNTHVVLDISNIGDRPALVTVFDDTNGYLVTNGNTTWSGLLEAGKSFTLRYTLKGDANPLPPAKAIYRDMHGVLREARSNPVNDSRGGGNNEVLLNVPPYIIITSMILSFLVITSIMGGMVLIAYLAARKGG